MGFKTYICNICGAEVTKPKSLAYKGGRCCRIHPEATTEQDTAKAFKYAAVCSWVLLDWMRVYPKAELATVAFDAARQCVEYLPGTRDMVGLINEMSNRDFGAFGRLVVEFWEQNRIAIQAGAKFGISVPSKFDKEPMIERFGKDMYHKYKIVFRLEWLKE